MNYFIYTSLYTKFVFNFQFENYYYYYYYYYYYCYYHLCNLYTWISAPATCCQVDLPFWGK